MCFEHIKNLKKDFNLPIEVCKQCDGDGEISTFCGHEVMENCSNCKGKGYLRMNQQTDKCKDCRKTFIIKTTDTNKKCPYCGSKNLKCIDIAY